MIISHKNQYLFIEIPHTGSSAIKHELQENYDGTSILRKHSFYSDFLKIATAQEKNYFVFAGVRNPLDEVVSKYYKMKTNHKGRYTDPAKHRRTLVRGGTKMSKEVLDHNIDFETFFMKYYLVPYTNFASLLVGHHDYMIRFENLQEDFSQVLQILGLEQKRPLPLRNPTQERSKNFWSYYTPRVLPRAKRVFGPFMKQWGYSFPQEWGDYEPTRWAQLEYEWVSYMRRFRWTYLRSMV